jgi:hypothetical protein
MNGDERRAAKGRLIAAMERGRPWCAVVRDMDDPPPLRRSGAYRLLREVRARGDEALRDGRHGHPSKMRGPVRQWLAAYCRGTPDAAGATVQAALRERFGLDVSVSQINRVRAALGLSQCAPGAGGKWGQHATT